MHRIVVADAARARLFHADIQLDQVDELEALVHPAAQLPTSERLSDRNSKLGPNSAATPHTEAKEHEREVFAREVAARVLADPKGYERLIVVAPPAFLGALRRELHAKLPKDKPVFDIAKDLTRVKVHELGAKVRALLPETAGMS